ncbi:methyltransferase domain-containing protein, partial [Patescibacteria group bacterium]|nr:methyltransferase domain-containing protein [Patescibacteria group bacterium]
MKLLNLACGNTLCSHSDWINVDKSGGPGIEKLDLLEPMPFSDGEFDVVYSSHFLEHLPKRFVPLFLEECRRVLKPGGILRVATPDLEMICRTYLDNLQAAKEGDKEAAERYSWTVIELLDQISRHRSGGEMLEYWKQDPIPAEEFVISRLGNEALRNIERLRVSPKKPSLVGHPYPCEQDAEAVGKFRLIGQVHLWMYDEFSLTRLLRQADFRGIRRCEADESQIPDFNSYQLDINADGNARKPDSFFLEARKKTHETPLALVIYNRPEKVAQVLDALAIIQPSPLYVFSDGSEKSKDVPLVEECRDLIMSRVDWTEPILIKRGKNRGLAESVVGAVDMVLSKYDRVVVLEDDCVPGPYFMEFMEMCLDEYENVDEVMAVTGYTFPVAQDLRDLYSWDVYFLPRIGSWGWGTWRGAWKHYERDLHVAYDKAKDIDLAQCGEDAK